MCGICGIVGERNESVIKRMTDIIAHRGPDDDGYYLDDNISMGVRRLAIIDLQTGHQPIANETKNLWVVLNGEIYNFQELRKDLEEKGHRFATKTDTEVITHSYEEYGVDCLKHFRGMFAFALWDKDKKSLFLARDRIGIKPIYYAVKNGKLIFASEIKALLEYDDITREIDIDALNLYLTFQYVPGPLTIFKGIKKLMPGNFLIYKGGNITIEQYWEIPFDGEQKVSDINEAKDRLKSLLEESIKYRLISDVPVGILLSGGVDSSAITGFAARLSNTKVKTFTIGFGKEGKKYDERIFARQVAEKFDTEHHEFTVMPDIISLLPRLLWHMDEPIADQAALPVYLLCKTARSDVTVLLTGEGGDEIFAGYPRYVLHKLALFLDRSPVLFREKFLNTAEKIPFLSDRIRESAGKLKKYYADPWKRNIIWISNFSEDEKRRLFRKEIINKKEETHDFFIDLMENRKFSNWLNQLLYLDMKTWLVDDILMKVDKMSMAASVEARVPLLDHKFVEFVASLPPEFKLNGLKGKFIFKEILRDILPEEIINRRKTAFRIPSGEWFKNSWKIMIKQHLFENSSSLHNYFDKEYLKNLVTCHFSGRAVNSQKLWNLLCFDIWHKIYIENRKEILDDCHSDQKGLKQYSLPEKQLLMAWDFPPQKGGIQTLIHSVYSSLGDRCVVIAPKTNNDNEFDLLSDLSVKRISNFKKTMPAVLYVPIYMLLTFIHSLREMVSSEIGLVHCGHVRLGLISYFLKLFFKKPYILWTYALELTDKRVKLFIKFVLKHADRIITISNYTKDVLISLDVAPSKITMIYPPVSPPFQVFLNSSVGSINSDAEKRIREKYNIGNKKILLTVARLSSLQRYKGIDHVLQALQIVDKSCKDYVYIICGDGDLRPYYSRLAAELGVGDRVIFTGNISDEEMPLYYSACNLFIMASREEINKKGTLAEGFGIVFLEANACGKPVIGGRSGGIPDAVKDGETGILVDPKNINEIADAIIKLLTDEKLAENMGRKGRERVAKEFTVEAAVKKLLNVVMEVEKERR